MGPWRNGTVITKLAPEGDHVPLRCKKCGAIFNTKNIHYIGARSIFQGYYAEDQTSEERVTEMRKAYDCDVAKHTISDLEVAEDLISKKVE